MERDISIDWSQDGTTSLKYKAQREHRQKTQKILRHLGNQKGANFMKFMPKMHQNTFGSRALPGPARDRRRRVEYRQHRGDGLGRGMR